MDTVLTCRLVSREWMQFIDDNIVWKRLFVRNKSWLTTHIKRFLDKDTRPFPESPNFWLEDQLLFSQKIPFQRYILDKIKTSPGPQFLDDSSGAIYLMSQKQVSTSPKCDNKRNNVRHDSASYEISVKTRQFMLNDEPENNSDSGTIIPNTINRSKPSNYIYALNLDWALVYKSFYNLEKNWREGNASMCTLYGHSDSIYCLQFDKHKFITGSRDKSIKVWDMRSLMCIKTLTGHNASVLCLKYDDEIMVTGSSDSSVIVWSMKTYNIITILRSHLAGVLDVTFSADYIISCSKDATIKVWGRKSDFPLLYTISGHAGPVNAISLHGNFLASASGDTLIKLWCLKTGAEKMVFKGHSRGLACVQFDGKTIISGSNDKSIKVWDAVTGECRFTLLGHTDLVRTLFFPGGNKAISGSYDQTVKVWDIQNGELLLDITKVHSSWVFDVQFDKSKIIR
ncbi:F-box/WD repeat-containing protein 11 [Smittium mucronatum]|uniref:F-box/WD repeat-containing protein 11 n=1 Tax=Smittium mucronatum TaxID=133383 RepID=A0A1R0H400_9FUNG|nr:F-box/WD repeat-containing protein 11 [Smittium mucronatum]